MNAGQLFATVTCLTGVILLLGWYYVAIDNPRSSTLLLKSVALFVLPTFILVALPQELFRFPLSLWIGALIEECLKGIAAATERTRLNRFVLVALFGIWELVWVKPLWGLNHSAFLADWNNMQLAALTAAAVVTVLMHCVTAEIYAFRFGGRLLYALPASWAVHVAFNESVGLLGVSLLASAVQFLVVAVLFAVLWPKGFRLAFEQEC
ncbi:MAG: hypothetical protein ABI454_06495 [Sphingomicrobium sp.]